MKKMGAKNIIDSYNVLVGMCVTLLTAVFGIYWYVFASYLVLNVFDWLSGWYKSRKQGKESSSVGLIGIVKKLGYWVIIAVSFILAGVFTHLGQDLLHIDLSFLNMIGWFTLACLLVNEIRSIIENLVECGYNVPNVLIKGLDVAGKMIDKDAEGDE